MKNGKESFLSNSEHIDNDENTHKTIHLQAEMYILMPTLQGFGDFRHWHCYLFEILALQTQDVSVQCSQYLSL